jgi:hypothetical protein
MSKKKHPVLKVVLIVFGFITALSAIANIANDSRIKTPVVADPPAITTQNEEVNERIVQNTVETQSVETISVENQDRDTINNSNVKTDQQTLSYQMLTGSTWEGKEYGVWGIGDFSDDLQDINLVFRSGGFTYSGAFTLTIKSNKLGNGSFQHTSSYDIIDDEIAFHMKRGERLYGKITGDIMTINWWYNKKFEVKKGN